MSGMVWSRVNVDTTLECRKRLEEGRAEKNNHSTANSQNNTFCL